MAAYFKTKIFFFKSMRCRGCQKPLSRCVVCSLYMNFDPPKSAITNENGRIKK